MSFFLCFFFFFFFFFFCFWYEINEECHICIHCQPGPLAALDCLLVCLLCFHVRMYVSAETIQNTANSDRQSDKRPGQTGMVRWTILEQILLYYLDINTNEQQHQLLLLLLYFLYYCCNNIFIFIYLFCIIMLLLLLLLLYCCLALI